MNSDTPWQVLSLPRTPYVEAWRLQHRLLAARQAGGVPDTLVLVEHPHVYTLGRKAVPEHLLFSPAELAERSVESYWVDRGGDITYHGPGQTVGYLICDLRERGLDAHGYLRAAEEVLLGALDAYGIAGRRDPEYTGVWVGDEKVAAIGVRVSRGVSMHGFALNVDPDLAMFSGIVPCGIRDRGVTSLRTLLGAAPDAEDVRAVLATAVQRVFGGQARRVTLGQALADAPDVPEPKSDPPARYAPVG
jgi:lipoate-protein ligase B